MEVFIHFPTRGPQIISLTLPKIALDEGCKLFSSQAP